MKQQVMCWQVWMLAKVVGGYDRLADRVAAARRDGERGNITTQQVIWIAVGAALAIAVAAAVTVMVMNKVHSINLDTPTP